MLSSRPQRLQTATSPLLELLGIPFDLRLVAELLSESEERTDFRGINTQAGLLNKYWLNHDPGFSRHLLFDYAVGRLVLGSDFGRFLEAIAREGDLSLFLRPSIGLSLQRSLAQEASHLLVGSHAIRFGRRRAGDRKDHWSSGYP
jgi:hypothetical protein